jgi:hypothetical protein
MITLKDIIDLNPQKCNIIIGNAKECNIIDVFRIPKNFIVTDMYVVKDKLVLHLKQEALVLDSNMKFDTDWVDEVI